MTREQREKLEVLEKCDTPAELRDMLTKHLLRQSGPLNKLRIPKIDDIQRLHHDIQVCRDINMMSSTYDSLYSEKLKSYLDALRQLVELNPTIIQSQMDYISNLQNWYKVVKDHIPFSKMMTDAGLSKMLNLASTLEDPPSTRDLENCYSRPLGGSWLFIDVAPTFADFADLFALTLDRAHPFSEWQDFATWHGFAPLIGEELLALLKKENPKAAIGLSAGGPVCRFITAIIPYIAGVQPSEEAVAKRLKDARRATRDNGDRKLSRVK